MRMEGIGVKIDREKLDDMRREIRAEERRELQAELDWQKQRQYEQDHLDIGVDELE
jgi:hypothetical protein